LTAIAPKKRYAASAMTLMVAAALLVPQAGWAQIEEIVVTARKKAESLQDVPLSVTAFTSEDIERKGINSVADVAKFSSSVQFDESFAQSDTRIAIRGLSPSRGRQNVAVLVDGIDLSSEAVTSSGGSLLLNNRLLDVERIEVVAGPQMALYGRAAFAGAIQYVTKDPSDEFEAGFQLDGNLEDQYSAQASVSGPVIGDLLGVRLNATLWDEQGFYTNSLTGDDVGSNEGYGLALTTRSDIGDNLSIKFRASYTDDEGKPSAQAYLPFNVSLPAPPEAFNANGAGANIAQCEENIPFIEALSAGVPGNDTNLLQEKQRIMDPALFNSITGGGDISDPAVAAQIIAANPWLSPHCESQVLSYQGTIPDGDDLTVALGTNPSTPGQDYKGFDRELWRFALTGDYELEKGTFTLTTGYLRDDNTETQDTNAFGVFDPTTPWRDANVNTFSFNNEKVTEQFQFDLRFASNLEGPVNVTLGGTVWEEEVANDSMSITGETSGTHCLWASLSGTLNPVGATDGCTGYTETTIAPYQQYAAPFRPTSPVNRDTEHYSIYGALDIDFAETWGLQLEGRYNKEDLTVEGPLAYVPGASGGPGGLNACGIFFRSCTPFNDWVNAGRWYDDTYFPWTDEDADGNATGQFALDQAALETIPTECWEQNPDAVMNSIANGPAEIQRNADGSPVLGPEGTAVLVLDANGHAIPTPGATDLFNPWCVGQLKDSDSWFSPKITLDWRPTDSMLLYINWADARKPGGFSTLTIGSSFLDREIAEFKPEKMQVWELGGNTEWLDNTLIVNGALFFQDYTDKQALTSRLNRAGDRLISKIENAGSAEVWGMEMSATWSPIRPFLGGDWLMNGSFTWLMNAEYTDFVIDSSSPVTAANAGNCTPDPGGADVCKVSYTGNELENSAPLAVVGSLQYVVGLFSEMDLFFETDAQYTDRRYTGVTNNVQTDAFWNLDMRLGLQGEKWDVLLYVNNVLDDNTVRSAGGGPGLGCCFVLGSGIDTSGAPIPTDTVMVDLPLFSTGSLPPPRVVGVRAAYRFGGSN
jgi:outer membrane receptor protein involved in Fe transport